MSRHIDRDIREKEVPDSNPVQSQGLSRGPGNAGDASKERGAGAITSDKNNHSIRLTEPSEKQQAEPDHGRDALIERPDASEREPALIRGRTCYVSLAGQELLHEIGRFRTVAVEDLANHLYRGHAAQMRSDLRSLADQDLVRRRTVWLNKNQGKLSVMVLTKAGKELLERARQSSAQIVYAGFVKPAEVAHDAAIYRMFHKEALRIEKSGGKIQRIVLDYELKRKIYSPLAKARHLPALEYAKRQAEVAQENGLRVIRGKIPLPDLRIEYETAQGDQTRIDLELATHHYHGSHLRTKAEAGFKMYAAAGEFSRRSAPLDERELTAEIFSL